MRVFFVFLFLCVSCGEWVAFGQYEGFLNPSCVPSRPLTRLPNETVYYGRCSSSPLGGLSSMNVCIPNQNRSEIHVWHTAGCPDSKPDQMIAHATFKCLPGPDHGGSIYRCQTTPILPPPAPLYGQIVSCPPTSGNCTNSDCNYNWMALHCVETAFGSVEQVCDMDNGKYALREYESEDCSGNATTTEYAANTCLEEAGLLWSYQCSKEPILPPGWKQ